MAAILSRGYELTYCKDPGDNMICSCPVTLELNQPEGTIET